MSPRDAHMRHARDMMQSAKLVGVVAEGAVRYRLGQPRRALARWSRAKLEDMGPSFVKLGQMIASRPDVFPSEVTSEFEPLLTQVTKVSFEQLRSRVPDGVVVDPEPLATGSIAQVHTGWYGGRRVAVKLKKPDIVRDLLIDLRTMRRMTDACAGAVPGMRDMKSFLDQFRVMIRQETNFAQEVESMEACQQRMGNVWVSVPHVYTEVCTEEAIVMDYAPAATVADYCKDAPVWQRRNTAAVLMNAFMRCLLSHGMFHADPHPGNIGLLDDGRIVMYDYGSVMTFDVPTRAALRNMTAFIITGDSNGMARAMIEQAIIVPPDGGRAFDESDVQKVEIYVRALMRYVQNTDLRDVTSAMQQVQGDTSSPFAFAPMFVLMLRAIALLEGTCKLLDPEFSYVASIIALFATDAGASVIESRAERDLSQLMQFMFGRSSSAL